MFTQDLLKSCLQTESVKGGMWARGEGGGGEGNLNSEEVGQYLEPQSCKCFPASL